MDHWLGSWLPCEKGRILIFDLWLNSAQCFSPSAWEMTNITKLALWAFIESLVTRLGQEVSGNGEVKMKEKRCRPTDVCLCSWAKWADRCPSSWEKGALEMSLHSGHWEVVGGRWVWKFHTLLYSRWLWTKKGFPVSRFFPLDSNSSW